MTFSSRLEWHAPPNALSILLDRKRAAGARILDLTESNPTRAELDYPAAEILDAFHNPRMLRYDPGPRGLLSAREQIAALHRVAADRVIVTASTSEAYSWLFKLLADPGDEILAPRPSYPLFEFLAALESVRVVQYPLAYHGAWSIDLEALERAITPRTRAVVLVNPNNPTGSYLKHNERAHLIEICARRSLAIISDEVFSGYALALPPDGIPTLAHIEDAPVFCLNGLSKLIGLPQMKLGWIVANQASARDRLELIADTYLSAGAPVQYALPHLLALRTRIQTQIIARLRTNLAFLPEARHVEGGWSAIVGARAP
jgi:aspartate/methionine/tyrosine aminotransferase